MSREVALIPPSILKMHFNLYTEAIKVRWKYLIMKAETECIFGWYFSKRSSLSGRDGAVYDEKVIIFNIYFL